MMDKENFIKAINLAVLDSISGDIDEYLTHPLSRKKEELNEIIEWYTKLDEKEKDMARRLINLSANHSVFGILCLLDGVRAIEDSPKKGKLELIYTNGDYKTILNEENGEYLHDIFNSQ